MSAALAEAIAYLEEEADRLDAEIAGNRARAAKIRAGVAELRDHFAACTTRPAGAATTVNPGGGTGAASAAPAVASTPTTPPDTTAPVVEELTPAPVVDGIPAAWRTGGARERILAVLADRGATRSTELRRFTDCPQARTAMALKTALARGEVARPDHGVYEITDLGRQVLAQVPPPPVSADTLADYTEHPAWREATTRRRVLRAVVALGSVTREQLATVLDRDPKSISTATSTLRQDGHIELRKNGTTATFHPTADGVRADEEPLVGRGRRAARPSERTPSTTATPTAAPPAAPAVDRVRELMADGKARTTDQIAGHLDLPITTIRSVLNHAGLIRGTGRHAGYWRQPRTGQGIPLDSLGPIERRPVADIDAARAAAATSAHGGGADL